MRSVRGTVISGKGKARGFTQLPWLRRQFIDKFGFEPYPGTLNLRAEQLEGQDAWRDLPWVPIEAGESGYCAARALAVRIDGRVPAVWIVPEVPGYPCNQIELMSHQSLRSALGLADGDSVTIQIRDGEP